MMAFAIQPSFVCGVQPSAPANMPETAGGWNKYSNNPVLGGEYGTCFDICVLKEHDTFRMWFSWRPKASIALVESRDGVHWSKPEIVLTANPTTGWEDDVNRPVVLKKNTLYHMWYSAFNTDGSSIGYATSADGVTWNRMSDKPVLVPEQPWEKACIMCPHVNWDEQAGSFKMWYSAGERNEPNAIGYATSQNGVQWTKCKNNPIFTPDGHNAWEQHKVTACQVLKQADWYVMFYIGFYDEGRAQIGLARSRDGITGWQRHPANPIVWPSKDGWDANACYKPYALLDGQKWLLWYNGRHDGFEQIGLVTREGSDLEFEQHK